tara:strand:- start:3120 stop:3233 length:114 start_codon:yes stop_codon:yes gene_type:complete
MLMLAYRKKVLEDARLGMVLALIKVSWLSFCHVKMKK